MLKREISKTDNNLFRSRTYTRVPRPAAVALCGEIAPFNYADQSKPASPKTPPAPYRSIQTLPTQTGSDDIEARVRLVPWSINTKVMESRDIHEDGGERERGRKRKYNFYYECLIDSVSRLKKWRDYFYFFFRRERIKMGLRSVSKKNNR